MGGGTVPFLGRSIQEAISSQASFGKRVGGHVGVCQCALKRSKKKKSRNLPSKGPFPKGAIHLGPHPSPNVLLVSWTDSSLSNQKAPIPPSPHPRPPEPSLLTFPKAQIALTPYPWISATLAPPSHPQVLVPTPLEEPDHCHPLIHLVWTSGSLPHPPRFTSHTLNSQLISRCWVWPYSYLSYSGSSPKPTGFSLLALARSVSLSAAWD